MTTPPEAKPDNGGPDDNRSLFDLLGFSEKHERHRLMAIVVGITIAWQIRAMRESRGWTQEHLGDLMQTTASAIARLESPSGAMRTTVSTLLKLSTVFDVALIVRFSDWKKWMEQMLGATAFVPPPFDQAPVIHKEEP